MSFHELLAKFKAEYSAHREPPRIHWGKLYTPHDWSKEEIQAHAHYDKLKLYRSELCIYGVHPMSRRFIRKMLHAEERLECLEVVDGLLAGEIRSEDYLEVLKDTKWTLEEVIRQSSDGVSSLTGVQDDRPRSSPAPSSAHVT